MKACVCVSVYGECVYSCMLEVVCVDSVCVCVCVCVCG